MLPCKDSNIVASDEKTSLFKLNRFALILKRQSNPLAVAGVEDSQGVGRHFVYVPQLIRRHREI